ncbi:MAG: Flp1 family type IVb pilin [Eubacteriales bacterium]|nr:Flp1 family type IVb pilin [Eubacteriales bacterium]
MTNYLKSLKQKLKGREALGTVEVVLIIAVLIAVALIFRKSISEFAKNLMDKVFNHSIIDQISYE